MQGKTFKVGTIVVAASVALASALTLGVSDTGTQVVKAVEGVKYTAYYDSVKVPTICYGSTLNVYMGMKASAHECTARLQRDLGVAARAVRELVKTPLTQNQFNALTSFVYNVGRGNFRKSTLLKKINAGDCTGAGKEFKKWKYAKGRELKGLQNRRRVEEALWNEGCHLWKCGKASKVG